MNFVSNANVLLTFAQIYGIISLINGEVDYKFTY